MKIARNILLGTLLFASAGAAAFYGPAKSEELAPYAGRTIVLDDMRGTAYYAKNGADIVVVTTLGSGGSAMRFVTTLQPGQSTKVSTPGTVDQPENAIEFKRDGDRLLVVEYRRPIRTSALEPGSHVSESR